MNTSNSFFEKFIPTDLLPTIPDAENKAEMEAYQKQKEFFHTLIADQYLKFVIRPIIDQYLSMKIEDHTELKLNWVLPTNIIKQYLSRLNDDELNDKFIKCESMYLSDLRKAGFL